MNFIKTILIISGIFGLVLLGRYIYFKPKYKTGVTAPNFSFTDIHGEQKSLEALKGSYILLEFWGSWCGPCRQEHPKLVNTYNQYVNKTFKGQATFDIISVGIETNTDRWKSAIQKDGLVWENHFADTDRFNSEIAKLYGVREIPTKYLINPDGKIVAVNPSFEFIHDFLDKRLQS